MNNILYEYNYTKCIEPIYGNKRNEIEDTLLYKESINKSNMLSNDNLERDIINDEVYTIDPEGCKDADDAFSIYEEDNKLYLAIHIADPTHYIPLNSLLWNDITNRGTTKYLSNRTPIHMIPDEILKLSSLMTFDKDENKYTISVITEINKNTYEPINNIQLKFCKVFIKKENSFSYKEASTYINKSNTMQLNISNALKIGLQISNSLFNLRKKKTKGIILSELSNAYIKYEDNNVCLYEDSHEEKLMKHMIAEFAIFANSFVGEYLKIHLNTGIFRTCVAKEWLDTIQSTISSEEMLQEIITNGIKADYISNIQSHDLVGMPEYCHFTSPIRRLSDCVCHYLLKFIYLKNKNIEHMIPFNKVELDNLSNICLKENKKDKKNQYLDIKFRLLQVMANMIYKNGNINIEYYITGYSGLFLNIMICKIDTYNVHMSYTLRIRNYNKDINPKEKFSLNVTHVNCFTKFDENTIPELDKHILE